MKFSNTTAVKKILSLKKKLKIIQGGSSAGKTIAILLILIDIAQTRKNILISVVSETFPHLRKAAIRDFLRIMTIHKYFLKTNWDKTNSIYTFETGSQIEFFSADTSGKVRGPRRQILFINECNNIDLDTFTQLSIRTEESIYLDFNPVGVFWINDIMPVVEHDHLILTYKDNEGLPASIIKELESRKENKNWWAVYGLGQFGELENKIYNNWRIIKDIPFEAQLIRRGLDFGYTNDPTVIEDIYEYPGGFIIDELIYQRGMLNKNIVDVLAFDNKQNILTIADSADPKSIDEIKSYGINIVGCKKGSGSVEHGIQFVQGLKISVTERSLKTIKAYRNYFFKVDKDGNRLNTPDDKIHEWSNSMDAIRYGLQSYKEEVIIEETPYYEEFLTYYRE